MVETHDAEDEGERVQARVLAGLAVRHGEREEEHEREGNRPRHAPARGLGDVAQPRVLVVFLSMFVVPAVLLLDQPALLLIHRRRCRRSA